MCTPRTCSGNFAKKTHQRYDNIVITISSLIVDNEYVLLLFVYMVLAKKMKSDGIIAEIQQNQNDYHSDDYSNPSNSSTFLLVLQTSFQQQLLQKYGNLITVMDGIYRTTKYGFPSFFVTVKYP